MKMKVRRVNLREVENCSCGVPHKLVSFIENIERVPIR
jgi:hypothetical protein